MKRINKVMGVMQVWDHGLGCEAPVTHAIVFDMAGIISKAREGMEVLRSHGLSAVRLNVHPDKWLGCHDATLLGMEVNKEGFFMLLHSGYIGTMPYSLEDTERLIKENIEAGIDVFSDTFTREEIDILISSADISSHLITISHN